MNQSIKEETNPSVSTMEHEEGNNDFEPDNEDFYFESDHLALRGNADYRAVLRAIVVLEAQRIEAGKHIDKIAAVQKQALSDPETFVKRLASGEKLDLPGPLNITTVSIIATSIFWLVSSSIGQFLTLHLKHFQLPKINFEAYNLNVSNSDDEETPEKQLVESNDVTVRGRVFDQTKPETFNQVGIIRVE